ncbi:aspartate/glutamate racemase family protein [Shimia sp. SDUM112013]|uniref:maleate cis-trans isomerase family protein n=1 Tax=Shimia sp. SDUM112013 TaxID=3136160 RepID=UPI0032EBEBBE
MKLSFETDQGIGTRASFGVVLLQEDETLEAELARLMALDGVALHHSRIRMANEIRPDTLARMEADLPDAVRMLPSAPSYDVIGYACTSAATVIGSDRVARAVQTVLPNAGVTDPLAAMIAAGRHLGVRRLGFVTPYVPEVSQQMRNRLSDAGFDIVAFGSFEESDDRVVARIRADSILNAALSVAAQSRCEALVIACTNLRVLRVLPAIEARLGIPVLSSNVALAWHMLRLAGVQGARPDMGCLFAAP